MPPRQNLRRHRHRGKDGLGLAIPPMRRNPCPRRTGEPMRMTSFHRSRTQRRLGDPESADAIQPAPPPAQNAAPPAANPDDVVLAQPRPDVAPQAQVPQDPIPPAPPLPAEIQMEAPPAPPLPAKDGIDEAPPAPPLTKTLIEKPATTPSAAGPVGAEALQQARQGLKKTADDPALREAGRKPPPTGADDLTSIMQKKFASMRMANGDPDPAKSAKDADEWDE